MTPPMRQLDCPEPFLVALSHLADDLADECSDAS